MRPSKKEREPRTKNIAVDDLRKAHFQNKGPFFVLVKQQKRTDLPLGVLFIIPEHKSRFG